MAAALISTTGSSSSTCPTTSDPNPKAVWSGSNRPSLCSSFTIADAGEVKRGDAFDPRARSTKAAVLSPACGTHRREREGGGGGGPSMGEGSVPERGDDDEDDGGAGHGGPMVLLRPLLLSLRRTSDPCGGGRRRADQGQRTRAPRHGARALSLLRRGSSPDPFPFLRR